MVSNNSNQMSIIRVSPGHLFGSVRVPQSKSMLHRGLIMSMLAGDISLAVVDPDSASEDIFATRTCLEALAAQTDRNSPVYFNCNESGSTLRFLVPLTAALGQSAVFKGKGRLPLRPLREYKKTFEGKGVTLVFPEEPDVFLPLRVSGQLRAGSFALPGHISSQYISGLMMALCVLPDDSEIEILTRLESEPYVEMTREVMDAFGVRTDKTDKGYRVPGNQEPMRMEPFEAEPDCSQAAFWHVANYLGASIEVRDIPLKSVQGDAQIVNILEALRAFSLSEEDETDESEFVIDASQIPDLIPVLSVACAGTPCTVKIINAQRLKIKESDRLSASHEMLTRLGVSVELTDEGMVIYGRDKHFEKALFRACSIDSYSDHRIVMAASVAALFADGPVAISDFRAVDKSYPAFFRDFRRMGGIADEFNMGE